MSLPIYHVGSAGQARPFYETDLDRDPRGILWVFEEPRANGTYVMGIDPSVGLTGWCRTARTRDDKLTDNAAIEVVRCGNPDAQVAEFAAPIDAYDLASVANIVGRMYGGNTEDGQCLSIVEAYPGPGLPVIQEMVHKCGYTNQYVWKYLDTMAPRQTHYIGFWASPKAVQMLWQKGSRWMKRGEVAIHSPALVEEAADAEMHKMLARAMHQGQHDDRLRALLLCGWAAHDWTMQVDTVVERVQTSDGPKVPPWQATDISAAELAAAWEERFSELGD